MSPSLESCTAKSTGESRSLTMTSLIAALCRLSSRCDIPFTVCFSILVSALRDLPQCSHSLHCQRGTVWSPYYKLHTVQFPSAYFKLAVIVVMVTVAVSVSVVIPIKLAIDVLISVVIVTRCLFPS